MLSWTLRIVPLLLLLTACGSDDGVVVGADGESTSSATTTSAPPTTAAQPTGATTTAPVATTTTTQPTSTTAATTTTPPTTTTTTVAAPIPPLPWHDNWTHGTEPMPVTQPCCSVPATGPVSPSGPLPPSGWPADGFYSAVASRTLPTTIELEIRRWIPCAELYSYCETEPPENGVVADPDESIVRTVELDASVTVVIQPINFPSEDEPPPLQASGTGFVELLTHLDNAVDRWVAEPLLSGSPLGEVYEALAVNSTDPAFPFGFHQDWGELSYRGPLGSYLTFFPYWRELADGDTSLRGENGLYNWWSALEIRSGKPVLYLFANRIAG
ncbi:MAG: hypothetical protein QNJ81_11460 [Acidimicrobiia bacterium]|nr:hypothetical protein [Acidimicrobiia bacterium]